MFGSDLRPNKCDHSKVSFARYSLSILRSFFHGGEMFGVFDNDKLLLEDSLIRVGQ